MTGRTAVARCEEPDRCLGDLDRRVLLFGRHRLVMASLVEAGPLVGERAQRAAAAGQEVQAAVRDSFWRQYYARLARVPVSVRPAVRELLRVVLSMDWYHAEAAFVDELCERVVSRDVEGLLEVAFSGQDRGWIRQWVLLVMRTFDQVPTDAVFLEAGCACRGRRWPTT